LSNIVQIWQGGGDPDNNVRSPVFDLTIGPASNYRFQYNHITPFNAASANTDVYGNRWGFYFHNWESPGGNNILQQNNVTGSVNEFDYGMCAFHFENSGPFFIERCNRERDIAT
jgi:hypothetical protein